MLEGKLERSTIPLAVTRTLPHGKCLFVWLLYEAAMQQSRNVQIPCRDRAGPMHSFTIMVSFTTDHMQANTGQLQVIAS